MRSTANLTAVSLAACLLAGTAVAQATFTAPQSGGSGGAGGSGGVVGTGDADSGVLATDPVAEPIDGGPGADGGLGVVRNDVIADPADAGLGATPVGAAGAGLDGAAAGTATGPITGISELPPGPVDDLDGFEGEAGFDEPDGDDGVGDGDDGPDDVLGDLPDGGSPFIDADGPVVIIPTDDEEPADGLAGDAVPELDEGVGGEVEPKMIEAGAGFEPATQ